MIQNLDIAGVSSNELMGRARKAGVAIPAFKIPHLPMVKPVIEAIRDEDCIGFNAMARLEWIKFESGSLEAVREEYERYRDAQYVRLHLDDVPVIDEDNERVDYLSVVQRALRVGYDSVMVDGSRLSLSGNIDATRSVVELSHAAGVPVEGELGAVFGHEEGPPRSYEEIFFKELGFTQPNDAREFLSESGCDWLSVAVGSIHGAVSVALRDKRKETGRIDLDHLKVLAEATGVPLVLHGGSGIEPRYVRSAIRLGIAMTNIGTEIRQAYEQQLSTAGSVEPARRSVYERARLIIREMIGASGSRARLV